LIARGPEAVFPSTQGETAMSVLDRFRLDGKRLFITGGSRGRHRRRYPRAGPQGRNR